MSHGVKGMEWGIKGEAVHGDKLTGSVCQNHSADDAVHARAKGPCLEREN